nr:hypothetical protein [Tanacetum cinerariifolium]
GDWRHWTLKLRPRCPSRGICTPTDSVTMCGHSFFKMFSSSMTNAKKMLVELR